MTNDNAFVDGLTSGLGLVTDQLEVVTGNFDLSGFMEFLIPFMVTFLALWGTWVGVRAILRSGRLVK